MQQQIKTMLNLQDAMNRRVHEQWREQGFEWYRAIWVECAELLDHYGWKWWKHQQPDLEQVELELIDIWHFGLSHLLQSESDLDVLAESITRELAAHKKGDDFRQTLEAFAGQVLTNKTFPVSLFGALMSGIDLSFEDLYRGYIGKNVLNFFRQDNGYKDGTYLKIWGTQEDNEHLVEISVSLDITSENYQEELYSALQQRYLEFQD